MNHVQMILIFKPWTSYYKCTHFGIVISVKVSKNKLFGAFFALTKCLESRFEAAELDRISSGINLEFPLVCTNFCSFLLSLASCI